MSESKHTPGPWKEVGAFVMTKDESIDICSSCNVNHLSLEEAIANAKLIAAAPDLLVALKDLQKAVREHGLLNIKKRFSLCAADAQANKTITQVETK